MSIFQRGLDTIYQKLSKPTQENNEFWFSLYNLLSPGQLKFYDQNPETFIKDGYVVNPHIYTTINRIIKPLSSVPFGVFEVEDERLLAKSINAKANGDMLMTKILTQKALKPLENDQFGIQKIFKQANECQTWEEFVQENVGFKLLLGNSFTYGLEPVGLQLDDGSRDERFFSKLYNLPAQFVEIIAGDWRQPIAGYKLLINNSVTFEADKVLHRKYWNPEYSSEGAFSFASTISALTSGNGGHNYYGMSPMAPLCRVVKRSNDSYIASMRMLENGIPAGILSSKTKPLNSDERQKLEESYMKKFGGSANKNKVLFASAEMKWESMGMNSVDMQLLDSNKADLEDIARVYDVPLPLLMNEASTMDNVRTSTRQLWQGAIIPELDELKSSLNMWLVPGWERQTGKKLFIDYDLSGVPAMQTNLKEQSERMLSEMEKGIWTVGEVRQALGGDLPEEEHMRNRLLSSGFQVLAPDDNIKTTLDILKSLSPLLANKLVEKLTEEEIRNLLKL